MKKLLMLAAALALSACARPGVARGDHLRCTIDYTLTVGPLLMESRADVVLEINGAARRWRVSELTIVTPWNGPEGVAPWAIFPLGRDVEIARIRADEVVLFQDGEAGFSINRVTGDAGMARAGAGGESEYSGGCAG